MTPLKLIGMKALGTELGALVEEKNKAYGDSFATAGEFLRLVFPDGVPPDRYSDMLCIIRIYDKLSRIAKDQDAFGESPWDDVVGYGLLAATRRRMMKKDNNAS